MHATLWFLRPDGSEHIFAVFFDEACFLIVRYAFIILHRDMLPLTYFSLLFSKMIFRYFQSFDTLDTIFFIFADAFSDGYWPLRRWCHAIFAITLIIIDDDMLMSSSLSFSADAGCRHYYLHSSRFLHFLLLHYAITLFITIIIDTPPPFFADTPAAIRHHAMPSRHFHAMPPWLLIAHIVFSFLLLNSLSGVTFSANFLASLSLPFSCPLG